MNKPNKIFKVIYSLKKSIFSSDNSGLIAKKSNFMDFDFIESELREIFKTKSVMFMGKNSISGLLEFEAFVKKLTPSMNAEWTKKFNSGSYLGISKSSNTKKLRIGITISENDYENFFKRHPQIKMRNKRGEVKTQ